MANGTKGGTKRAAVVRDMLRRLRKMEARELPREVQFKTSIALHSDGNHMVAGFVMGAGFTREVAQEIARRCNAHEAMVALLRRFSLTDCANAIAPMQVEAAEILAAIEGES